MFVVQRPIVSQSDCDSTTGCSTGPTSCSTSVCFATTRSRSLVYLQKSAPAVQSPDRVLVVRLPHVLVNTTLMVIWHLASLINRRSCCLPPPRTHRFRPWPATAFTCFFVLLPETLLVESWFFDSQLEMGARRPDALESRSLRVELEAPVMDSTLRRQHRRIGAPAQLVAHRVHGRAPRDGPPACCVSTDASSPRSLLVPLVLRRVMVAEEPRRVRQLVEQRLARHEPLVRRGRGRERPALPTTSRPSIGSARSPACGAFGKPSGTTPATRPMSGTSATGAARLSLQVDR